ncbi:MAG: hypothetical protein ACI8S3_002673 [Alphaproteobacteria bacterium]|jgi:uncharacterized protein (DUF1330 family)
MAAYVIVDSSVHDPDRIKAYGAKVGETLKGHGARPIVAGNAIEVLEGDWNPSRLIVLEFADADAARAWYNSPEYQEILPIRLEAANDKMLIVEGV